MDFKKIFDRLISEALNVADNGGINNSYEFFDYIDDELPRHMEQRFCDLFRELEFPLRRLYSDIIEKGHDQITTVSEFFMDPDVADLFTEAGRLL